MDDRVVITSALRLSSLHTVAKSPDTSCKPKTHTHSFSYKAFSLTTPRQQRRRRLLDRSRMQRRHHLRLPPLPPPRHQLHLPHAHAHQQLPPANRRRVDDEPLAAVADGAVLAAAGL